MGRLFGTGNRAESLRLRTTEVIRAAQRFGRRRLARACGLSGLANELTAGSLQSVDELRRVALNPKFPYKLASVEEVLELRPELRPPD